MRALGGNPPMIFLQDGDTDSLIRASAANHEAWMARNAEIAGGEVRRREGLTWTYQPRPMEEVTLAFPRFDEKNAGDQIDGFLEYCREHRPLRQIAVWLAGESQPADLGARLVARGFNWGWQPHWMGLDLEGLELETPSPEGIRIGEVMPDADWSHKEMRRENLKTDPLHYSLTQQRPQSVWLFVATVEKQVVGHCTLNMT